MNSTWDAINEFERLLIHVDNTLSRGLRRDLERTDSFGSPELELARPGLADGEASYEELEITAASGLPIEEDPVVASIVDLYRAGAVNLPHAAGLYGQARDALNDLSVPSEPRYLTALSRLPFEWARDRLASVLGSIHDSLVDSGAAMVQAAEDYELDDEQSAEALRQIGQFLPPAGSIPVGLPA